MLSANLALLLIDISQASITNKALESNYSHINSVLSLHRIGTKPLYTNYDPRYPIHIRLARPVILLQGVLSYLGISFELYNVSIILYIMQSGARFTGWNKLDQHLIKDINK